MAEQALRRLPAAAGLLTAAIVLLLASTPASGHEMNLARYRLATTEEGLELELTLPATFAELRGEAGVVAWPAPCVETGRSLEPSGQLVRMTLRARCPRAPPADASIRAPWGADGAVLVTASGVRVLAARETGVELPLPDAARPGPHALAAEYLRLGVAHILEGWDHLAFVLCLFLLAARWALFWLVTAFTVGHSASLALSHFGVLAVPTAPTEAVIALSIVFMAREALLAESDASRVDRRALVVVVLFGALHGLGFATVLGDLGVAAGDRVTGLLAFNVGVECGQLSFIALLAALWTGLRAARVEAPARFALLSSAGSVGAWWFTERFVSLASP
ncbi:MAG: HupE/UreJ family protein [Pseudomonadales bacterium]|jgi:hypothetical protein|nr:HupE/UreJ family protein [Pseudomonadales bacterium]